MDSRLCVSGNGEVLGEVVFERIESCYLEKQIVSGENAKISAFCTRKHFE